jgi:hypothetical protein
MAVNAVQSALSSRRLEKWLPWFAALVLAAGVTAFLVVHFGGNTAKVEPSQPSGPAIHFAKPQKNIAFPKAAWRVAREFVFTAVARRKLAESYGISHPTLRAGFTLKQWETGSLPGIPFVPVAGIQRINWKNTNYAHPRDAQVNVLVIPTKASHQKAFIAQIGLLKIGRASHARWTVSYFGAISGPPIPTH